MKNNSIKMGKNMNKQFIKEKTQVTNTHKKETKFLTNKRNANNNRFHSYSSKQKTF